MRAVPAAGERMRRAAEGSEVALFGASVPSAFGASVSSSFGAAVLESASLLGAGVEAGGGGTSRLHSHRASLELASVHTLSSHVYWSVVTSHESFFSSQAPTQVRRGVAVVYLGRAPGGGPYFVCHDLNFALVSSKGARRPWHSSAVFGTWT